MRFSVNTVIGRSNECGLAITGKMDVCASNGSSNLKETNMKANNQPTSSNATRTNQLKQAPMSNMSQADKKLSGVCLGTRC